MSRLLGRAAPRGRCIARLCATGDSSPLRVQTIDMPSNIAFIRHAAERHSSRPRRGDDRRIDGQEPKSLLSQFGETFANRTSRLRSSIVRFEPIRPPYDWRGSSAYRPEYWWRVCYGRARSIDECLAFIEQLMLARARASPADIAWAMRRRLRVRAPRATANTDRAAIRALGERCRRDPSGRSHPLVPPP